MPECSVCGPVDEPLAVHVETEQHRTLAAMEQDLAQPVPDWVDAVMPPRGPCLLCGGRDARHRVLDAIVEHAEAGEDHGFIADSYDVPVEFVDRVVREWR